MDTTARLMEFNFDIHEASTIFSLKNSKEKGYNIKILRSGLIDIFIMLLYINFCVFKILQNK